MSKHLPQNVSLPSFVTLVGLLLLLAPAHAQTKQWNQGNPSPGEQFALEVINRVRKDPVAAVDFYASEQTAKPIVAGAFSGVITRDSSNQQVTGAAAAKLLAQNDVTRYNGLGAPHGTLPKAPLAFYPLFIEQATARENDPINKVGASAFFGQAASASLPGKVPTIFLTAFSTNLVPGPGITFSGANATGGTAILDGDIAGIKTLVSRSAFVLGVSLFDSSLTLREAFITRGTNYETWLDDAYTFTGGAGPSGTTPIVYGHMRMIGLHISAPRTSDPGAGARVLTAFGTDVEALSTSDLPFGTDTVFITGVVYQDSDKDGDYTPGEGLAGVKVTLNKGEWFAVTSASGGYAIPVQKGSGVYTVSAVSTDGTTLNTSNVATVNNDSVKIDFVTQPVKPTQVTIGDSDGDNRFINLSTRGVAASGNDTMIAGFVISGTGTKRVLIRGISSSLLGFGLTGVLRQPKLTLYDSHSVAIKTVTVLDTYENQRFTPASPVSSTFSGPADVIKVKADLAAAFAQVGAFQLTPPAWAKTPDLQNWFQYAEGDTAMVVDLQPGLYSAGISPDGDPQVQSDFVDYGNVAPYYSSGSAGIVLLEIYDMTPNGTSRFINLSTRGRIETGARQMIVGYVISGSGHKQVLVRGIGPTLKGFGLTTALDDSAVTLYDSTSTPILNNDDWGLSTWADQTVTVSAQVGAFGLPAESKDGVILASVTPGLYSVGIKSPTGQTGVGLAEIYEHP